MRLYQVMHFVTSDATLRRMEMLYNDATINEQPGQYIFAKIWRIGNGMFIFDKRPIDEVQKILEEVWMTNYFVTDITENIRNSWFTAWTNDKVITEMFNEIVVFWNELHKDKQPPPLSTNPTHESSEKKADVTSNLVKRIDEILEKISVSGLPSLSPEEKELLDKYSKR